MPQQFHEFKSIQILRGVAATSVVYFHIGASPNFGMFGIDIFFVISGFVMSLLVANRQTASAFAISRLTRIVPLYWILTTTLLILATINPSLLNSTTADLQNYIKSILFIPYFKENGALHPMLVVGWTLNFEIYFYFCIWIAILFARPFYLPVTFVLIFFSYFYLGKQIDNRVMSEFFSNTILFEFLFGMLIFRLYSWNPCRNCSKYLFGSIAAFSYVFMAMAESGNHFAQIDRLWLYGLPSSILVFSLLGIEELFVQKYSPVVKLLTRIGDASYATYLSHLYVVEGYKKIVSPNLLSPGSPIGVICILFLALLVGHIANKLVDQPLRAHFKKKNVTSYRTNLRC